MDCRTSRIQCSRRNKHLAAECEEVGPKEPLTREKLSPVIAVLKAEDTEDGLTKARQMVEFNGLGHSAAIHTKDERAC